MLPRPRHAHSRFAKEVEAGRSLLILRAVDTERAQGALLLAGAVNVSDVGRLDIGSPPEAGETRG